MKIILSWIIALLATTAAAQPSVSVETAAATSEYRVARTPASGVVLSREDAAIATELAGRLTWIAEVGDEVLAGQPLAQLDQHLLELDQRNRAAAVIRLQANLDWLSRQTGRLDELAVKNNTAHSELDEVRSRFSMLQQELVQAEVELERANYDLQRAVIIAPFDGVVVSRAVAAGEYALAGRELLRLVNTSAAEISVSAPLQLARFIAAGDQVGVFNKDFEGSAVVRRIIPVGDSRSHMMELRVTPAAGDWFIGEAVTVSLPASSAGVLISIPRDALVLRDQSNFVYVVQADNTARRIRVELGSGLGERIAVSGDIQAGDEVIVRGAERLRDGQAVERLGQRLSMR